MLTNADLPEWVGMIAAQHITGRSKRTLRRWIAEPELSIRTHMHNGMRQMNTADLLRAEASKTAYRDTPTFGR